MKRFLFFAVFLIIYSLSLHSQGVVVSEYFNTYTKGLIKPDGEWAELIVTKDGVSLVGCKIRDYSSSSGDWMPAFQFNDIPLWKNLHEGTIIMVYFKIAPLTDEDKSDGYIQVSAEDTKYFTFLGSNKSGSLNISQNYDMVQIYDQSDNNIHTLGHAKSGDEAVFLSISGMNKICYSSDIAVDMAIAVLPGGNLNEYNKDYDATKIWTTSYTKSESSPGLPNRNSIHTRSNINFWRVLREPEWSNPTFSTSDPSSKDNIILTWKPISNTANDNVEGYILLRAEGTSWPANSLPLDSKIYAKGDIIGQAVVVDHIKKLSTDIYTDKTGLKCGKTYIYALVAYRYDADYFEEDKNKNELSARGRAYNETNYAITSALTLDEPKTPKIYTINDINDLCRGDELTIYLKDSNSFKDCTYQWLKDGIEIAGETAKKINAKQAGNYSLKIINSVGCESISLAIKIEVYDAPIVLIQEDKGGGKLKKFLNDTTIFICKGDALIFVGGITGKADSIQWLKDGFVVQKGGASFTVVANGSYQVLAYSGICPGQSAVITVRIIEVDLSITPNSLILDYDINPIGTIKIINRKANEIVLQAKDIILPMGFTIVNPSSAPYIVPSFYFLDLDIKFDTDEFKTVSGQMQLNAPCGNQFNVDLTGIRKKPNSTFPVAELTNIDFGIIPNCSFKDTSFVITMVGNDEIVIKSDKNLDKYLAYTVVYDTGEQNPNLPWKLNDGDVIVYISFSNINPGIYSEAIVLDYTVNGVDSPTPITISLNGETQLPNLDVLDGYKKLNFQLYGCDNTLDTVIRVTNNSSFDITINNNFADNHIQFKSLPQVIHHKDTVDLAVTLTAGIYPPTTFTYEPCAVQSDSIAVEISALAPDMVFSLPNNEIDFGTIDNCQFSGDSIIKVAFSGTDVPCTIGSINVPLGLELVGLNVGDNVTTAGGQFDVVFKSDFIGIMDDSIEITLNPCDIKKVIRVKGERFIPLEPLVSSVMLDFGEYILGEPYAEKILSMTNNDTRDIMINSIQGVTAPYVLVNNDLPYLLKAGEKKDYTFRYERTIESVSDVLEVKIIYDSYCDFDNTIQLKGKAKTGILPANIKLSIQSGISVGLGETVKVPVTIQVNDTTTLAKCGIKSVKFGIQYDSKVLNITNALVGNAIKSQVTGFNLVRKSLGNDEISFNINPNYDMVQGNLAEIEFLGLLGDTTQTAIAIIAPELVSDIRIINLEIKNGSAQVIGQCPLNNRLIELSGQQGGIISILPNPVSDIVTITIEVISDDNTNCAIYDYLGKSLRSIINESLKPDIYEFKVSVNDLQSGVYYIVFKNGIIINTTKLIINK